MEDVWVWIELRLDVLRRIFSYENLTALLLAIIILLVIILTSDSDPQWIYQGF